CHGCEAACGAVAAVLAPTVVPLALLLFASWLLSAGRDPFGLDEQNPLVQWLVSGGSVNTLAAALFGPLLLLQLLNPIFALLCVLFANTAVPGLPRFWTSSQYLLASLSL